LIKLREYATISDMKDMEGFTVKEIVEKLGITPDTAKKRLQKHGIKPIKYAGPTAMYEETAVAKIRVSAPVGRPPKAKPENQA
jgi:uncharacterized protein YjcR